MDTWVGVLIPFLRCLLRQEGPRTEIQLAGLGWAGEAGWDLQKVKENTLGPGREVKWGTGRDGLLCGVGCHFRFVSWLPPWL